MLMEVTRLELARHLEPLFARGGTVDREAVLRAVSVTRPEVARVLGQLPARQFTSLRQIWEYLPLVPIGL